jgi:hypothetical protein
LAESKEMPGGCRKLHNHLRGSDTPFVQSGLGFGRAYCTLLQSSIVRSNGRLACDPDSLLFVSTYRHPPPRPLYPSRFGRLDGPHPTVTTQPATMATSQRSSSDLVSELTEQLLSGQKKEVFAFLQTLPAARAQRIKEKLISALKKVWCCFLLFCFTVWCFVWFVCLFVFACFLLEQTKSNQ